MKTRVIFALLAFVAPMLFMGCSSEEDFIDEGFSLVEKGRGVNLFVMSIGSECPESLEHKFICIESDAEFEALELSDRQKTALYERHGKTIDWSTQSVVLSCHETLHGGLVDTQVYQKGDRYHFFITETGYIRPAVISCNLIVAVIDAKKLKKGNMSVTWAESDDKNAPKKTW